MSSLALRVKLAQVHYSSPRSINLSSSVSTCSCSICRSGFSVSSFHLLMACSLPRVGSLFAAVQHLALLFVLGCVCLDRKVQISSFQSVRSYLVRRVSGCDSVFLCSTSLLVSGLLFRSRRIYIVSRVKICSVHVRTLRI